MTIITVQSETQQIISSPGANQEITVIPAPVSIIHVDAPTPSDVLEDTSKTILTVENITEPNIVVNSPVYSVAVISAGPMGPPGVSGPIGPSDDLFKYVHTQEVAASIWIIDHDLNGYPQVTVIEDGTLDVVEGDVAYASLNQVVLTFSTSLTGKAYLS